MASEIRVNQIQNRSGLSTVTFSDTGVVLSGVTTVSTLSATSITGNLTGNITIGAGSTSAPSLAPTGDSNTGIFFPSPDTIAFAEGGAEALRIDSSGNIGIGINLPGRKLEVCGSHSSGNITPSLKISGNGWSLNGGTALEFGHDPANYPTWVTGRIASTYSGSAWGGGLKFFYNNGTTAATLTEGMELTRDGNLAFPTGKGIDFSATANGSGTMTSELLSDYEEGTWTPVPNGVSVVSGSPTYVGTYTKIGRMVHASIFQTAGTGTINVVAGSYFTGLPFTPANYHNTGSWSCATTGKSGVSNIFNSNSAIYIQQLISTGTSLTQFITSGVYTV
jgi:hypothetical protein